MPDIKILDENTINQIAAGEVIERPSSVVKELLENAIDAGATAVTCEIKEGGIDFIRVTDNGCGIPKDEISLAFQRHSTSKIHSAEDLPFVSSLGFRGEALASIAAVSQVEMLTRTRGSLTGMRFIIDGGEERLLEEVGTPEGTTIIVRNLFYNTPARRKFLKTPQTEAAHAADLVEKIALSHPEVSVRYIQNGQNRLFTSGNNNLKDIIYTIYGREITSDLIAVGKNYEAVTVSGYIGKPVIARGNRSFENYFVNGRYIKNAVIGKAIEEAYRPFMMQHKYPFTMLTLTIEPELMDVNVHPAKMELRFRDGDNIYRMVRDTLSEALSDRELIVNVHLDDKEEKQEERVIKKLTQSNAAAFPEPFETNRKSVSAVNEQKVNEESSPYSPVSEAEPRQMDMFKDRLLSPESRKRHRLIGQIFATYWLVEFEDNLYIIDQHAAHEKVLYEQMMAAFKNKENTSQQIDPPLIVTLTAAQEKLLADHLSYFTDLGFVIEPFGGREYALRALPDNLYALAGKELFVQMLDELTEDTFTGSPAMIYEKVASMSCKAAVKGRHTMSAAEADKLIDELLGLDNPYACPHGRPTIISMSKRELEKKFKRIV